MYQSQNFETIEELAERLRVKKSWIYGKTMNTGEHSIPRVKVGKYLRFVPEEVDAWLKKQNEAE